ncbi:MAG: hypothetical protein IPO92_02750 [Saprospiraceae bacterium]|nr:hypothetical protein [Saprospiraceae bacterium]
MRYTKEQIDQWISEWNQSGQSIIKYCEGKPFDKSTFYNWRKKLIWSSEVVKKTENLYRFKSLLPIFHMSIQYPNGVRIDLHSLMSIEDIRVLSGC